MEAAKLTYHACCAPDVSWGPILGTDQHLHGPVLPSLNILSEVLVHPAGVAKVCNLDLDLVCILGLQRVH